MGYDNEDEIISALDNANGSIEGAIELLQPNNVNVE